MDILDFKNVHNEMGDRVFITASGPSLLEFDPTILRKEHIICVNDTIERFPWTRYGISADSGPAHKYIDQVPVMFCTNRMTQDNHVYIAKAKAFGFSFDLTQSGVTGRTTTYLALQLAVWMGFKTIYLVGLDLCVTNTHTHFYGTKKNFQWMTGKHFVVMQRSFKQAAKSLKDTDVKVYNCSPVSTVTVFPKVNIKEVLCLEKQ